jgi:hypothetical protein
VCAMRMGVRDHGPNDDELMSDVDIHNLIGGILFFGACVWAMLTIASVLQVRRDE